MQHPKTLPWGLAVLPKWSFTGLCYFITLTRVLAPILTLETPPTLALAAWWKTYGPALASSWYFLYILLLFFSVLSGFFSNKVTSDLTDNIRVKNNPCALRSPDAQRVKLRTGKTGRRYMYPQNAFSIFFDCFSTNNTYYFLFHCYGISELFSTTSGF